MREPVRGPGLEGIRVLEIGEMVSGPYAAKLLGDLGADVIKVEDAEGDPARRRGPFAHSPDPEASGLFLALNTNKRNVTVDRSNATERLAPLLAEADVVITNLRPERLDLLGIDLDALHRSRPDLVICSITPFGLTGPHADYRAEELTVAHGGGWAYQCPGASTEIDQPPLKVSGHQTEFHAGLVAALVSLAAFDRAERSGVGDLIDLSSLAYTAGMLEAAVIAASYMGENPSRLGSRLLNPWKIFECRDGLIFLVTVEQDQWDRLVDFLGRPEWATTGLFDSLELRLENEDLLTLYLQEAIAEHAVDDLWRRGQEARICFAPVFRMADLKAQEHLQARQFFAEVEHPVAGTLTHLGPPFVSSNDLWGPLRPAPALEPDARPTFNPRRSRRNGHPASPGEPSEQRPLEGVRVLDLTWVWAGPYGAMHLAHLGAEVIKIESALRPGLGRRLAIHPPDVEPTLNTSAYFNQWGQGKLSCQLDLSRPEAITIVKDLVARCDVVMENFATGVMERLGLDYETLEAINPEVIVASISGYGSVGPLREFMGYGPTTGPLSGLTSLTGYENGPPRELGISIGDPGAGITAAFAVCAALVARRATGEGCYLDVALWESTASCAVEGWMSQELTGNQPERMGNHDPIMAPHNCYRAAEAAEPGDGPSAGDLNDPGQWLSIACVSDDEWLALARLVEPPLDSDPRFETSALRKRNEGELDEAIGAWVRTRDRWELTAELQSVGVAAFPSMSPKDLLSYEHLWERGFYERLDHPEVGARVHPGIPWRHSSAPNGVSRPAPTIGQHTDDVLGRLLGMTPATIARLRADGICS